MKIIEDADLIEITLHSESFLIFILVYVPDELLVVGCWFSKARLYAQVNSLGNIIMRLASIIFCNILAVELLRSAAS